MNRVFTAVSKAFSFVLIVYGKNIFEPIDDCYYRGPLK